MRKTNLCFDVNPTRPSQPFNMHGRLFFSWCFLFRLCRISKSHLWTKYYIKLPLEANIVTPRPVLSSLGAPHKSPQGLTQSRCCPPLVHGGPFSVNLLFSKHLGCSGFFLYSGSFWPCDHCIFIIWNSLVQIILRKGP